MPLHERAFPLDEGDAAMDMLVDVLKAVLELCNGTIHW